MINVQFSTPQEMVDFISLCNNTQVRPIFALPVKNYGENKANKPTVPPIPIPKISTAKNKERIAAEKHWKFIEMHNEWDRSELSEESANNFVKSWIGFANKWYESLTPKEKYGLMRSSNVSLFSQCDDAWNALSEFDKCNISKRAIRFKITQIKDEFLPPDIC